MSDDFKLKCCPFCGAPAKFSSYTAYSIDSSFDYVGCTGDDCGALIMDGTAKQWNKRVKIEEDDLC